MPKHQFWTDIPLLGLTADRPLHYIAKQELFAYPGARHFLTWLGGVPIDRSHPIKTLDSFRYMEALLKKGELIVLFPEGTYYPHAMGRGKHRLIQRLLKLQDKPDLGKFPFIPVGMRYLEKGVRREVQIRFGVPLHASAQEDGETFTRRIVEEIAGLSGMENSRSKHETAK